MSGSVPPRRLAITVKGPDSAQDPSGKSSTARRCCSNCDVRAPSIVQCPLLCGRIASSLTSSPPAGVSNNSTASSPITSGAEALRSARACAAAATSGSSPGAGAMTSRQMPSTWTVCTTGYAAPWPDGDLATSAASSRRNGTNSSASSATPCSTTSAAAAGDAHSQTPLPSYPPLTALSITGHDPPANASTSATVETAAYRGHGTPRDVSASRIASLSWVYRSAAEPGLTSTPVDSSSDKTGPGTCSWSNVTTSH